MNIIRAIGAFFGRMRFWMSWPYRAMTAQRSSLKERKVGLFAKLTYPLLRLLAFLLYSIANAGELVIGWSRSRHARAFLFGAPALLGIGLTLFILIYLYNIKQSGLINTYLLRATKAENVERYDTARMYYQKLLQLDKTNQSYEFLIAKSYDSEGNYEEAEIRMQSLERKPDVSGAVNFWFARKTLEREDLEPEIKWKKCLRHLNKFLDGAPRHFEANSLAQLAHLKLADLYTATRNYSDARDEVVKAIAHTEVMAESYPRFMLALARLQLRQSRLYRELKDTVNENELAAQSAVSAEKAVQHFRNEIEKSRENMEALLLLSDSLLFQKRYDDAIKPLDTAIGRDLQKRVTPQLKEFKSKIYSAWASELLQQGTRSLAQCIGLIDQAIGQDPKNQQALQLLAQISIMNNDEVSLAAKQKLEQAIGEAPAPFSVHMILGSYAAVNKDDDLAVKHLRQALMLDRKATAVMNNLAFVLARLKKPRFEEALSLINNALKISPNNPRFLDTRGNIFIQMKQYELAFHDLEVAELQMKNNVTLYENLLFLTKELGFDDIYRKKYEKRLKELKTPAPESE